MLYFLFERREYLDKYFAEKCTTMPKLSYTADFFYAGLPRAHFYFVFYVEELPVLARIQKSQQKINKKTF